jgi:hypothetical protein
MTATLLVSWTNAELRMVERVPAVPFLRRMDCARTRLLALQPPPLFSYGLSGRLSSPYNADSF